ncbi:MAG: amino acid permease [Deltaproteobacteria bacterium]|nr:amino acid permease [Deltaproteobacteria bacterium]
MPLPRRIGVATASLLVVASMVGTGVFTTGGFLVRDIGSPLAVLACWVVGGCAALCGALAYGELCAALPENGGEYALLRRIYHPSVGFVAGFVSLVGGFSAPIAAAAIACQRYLGAALGRDVSVAWPVALVLGLSLLHTWRVSAGSRFQNLVTAAKISLVLLVAGMGLALGVPDRIRAAGPVPTGTAILSGSFAVGLVYVSYAFSGWNAVAYVAGEVRAPRRGVPTALVVGTALVTLLYLLVNAAFLAAAPAADLAGVVEVGHVAARAILGDGAARVLSGVIALGLVSTIGALVMTGPRVYEAMGHDHPRLALLGRRGSEGGPGMAIWIQAAVAIGLLLTTSFDTLLAWVGVVLSLATALTAAGVLVLRRREPGLFRPVRAPIWAPLVYIALTAWMIAHVAWERPAVLAAGGVTIALGLLLWFSVRVKPSRTLRTTEP